MSDKDKPLVGMQDESGPSTKTVTYSTVLGRGAFATVYKAKCGLLPCAAKILHAIFTEDPAMKALIEKFYQECEHLKNIKHPNIVQYLGVCREPDTQQPVLLMEMLEQSLTHFLERSDAPLLRHVELSICHDVALALEYLHSVKIVHRDLSSNNVLLIGPGSRAKVSDFGMSRVIDTSKTKYTTPLSMAPGTVVYMPHEALGANPKYTEKIDCFSFGVLSIQIMTRQFPNPTDRFKEIESPFSPVGTATIPVLETECRKEHIDMISKSDPLLGIALDCLSLRKDQRPSAQELCRRVENLKDDLACAQLSIAGSESCRCAELQIANRILEEKVATLEQQLKASAQQNASPAGAKACGEYEEARLPLLPLKSKLQANDFNPLVVFSPTQWRTGAPAPRTVAASSSATFDSSLYCHCSGQIYEYDLKTDKWISFPKLPLDSSNVSLTIYEDFSTVFTAVNEKVYIMHDGKWCLQGEMRFKPWDIIRQEEYFIAFGSPNQIDVFQFVSKVLYKRSSFSALALDYASVEVCNGALYFVGVCMKQSWTTNVYKLPIAEIVQIPKVSWFSFEKIPKVSYSEIAPLPVVRSTCVGFKNHLLSVGGFKNKRACGDIFRYDEDGDKWALVGSIPTPRYNCLAEIVDGQLVVVGGWLSQHKKCDLVEIATLNF